MLAVVWNGGIGEAGGADEHAPNTKNTNGSSLADLRIA
jgi:hypothetical protein